MALATSDFFANPITGINLSSNSPNDSSSSDQSNSPSHSSSGNSPAGSGPATLPNSEYHGLHRGSFTSASPNLFEGLHLSGQLHSFDSNNKDGSQRRPSTRSSSNLEMEIGDDDDDGDDLDGGDKDKKDGKAGQKAAQTSAERRATHNAIERARRESLNGRFMQLAQSLPSMANVKRPSKSIIVNKSLEYIQESVVREHNLIRENVELRREVDELRSRLGMPPLPPATPAGLAGHLPTAQQFALAHAHQVAAAAPGAATIPPEMPGLHTYRPYAITSAGVVPMHGHAHPALLGMRPNLPMMAHHPYGVSPEAAALLSPAVFHPHAHGPQPQVVEQNPFDVATSTPAPGHASLHHGYAGAIMGNPPAMINQHAGLQNGSGQVTPKAAGGPAPKEKSGNGRKRSIDDGPGASDPPAVKRPKSEDGVDSPERSNSGSSVSSGASNSPGSPPVQIRQSNFPTLSGINLDSTNFAGLVNPGGIFGSHTEEGGLLSAASSAPAVSSWLGHAGVTVEGPSAGGANPFGLFSAS